MSGDDGDRREQCGGGGGPVDVAIFRPAAALQPFVTFYYFVTVTAPIRDFLYPEWGNVRLALTGAWQVAVPDHYDRVPLPNVLFGPTDRCSLVTAGPGRMVGFGVTPIGWATLFGGDASMMANAVRPLGAELAVDPAALNAAFLGDGDDEAAGVARWDALIGDLVARRPVDPRMIAVDQALRSAPPDVTVFAERLGVSERSLHRLCLQTFGFPPKRLLNRQRFLRTLGRVRSAVRSPVLTALDEGYYDVPHFYRDLRVFMGMSAKEYFAAERPLMHTAARAQQQAGVTLSFALAEPPAPEPLVREPPAREPAARERHAAMSDFTNTRM